MRIPRIYTDQPLKEGSSIHLSPTAAHYVANVLRMKAGRDMILFNGQGGEYTAVLNSVSKKTVSVSLINFVDINTESPLSIELGVCLIKADRMDWLIQKATELGVASISPLISEFTDTNLPADRYPKKIQHWRQIVENACQQCGRTVLPSIYSPQPLSQWLEQVEADSKWVLHPYQATKLKPTGDRVKTIALLAGPEGGLSDGECALARQQQFTAICLGPRILRTETAPLAALSLLQYQFGDL